VNITLERPDQADVVALIDALDAYQKPLYPPESHHGVDINALLAANVLFAVARDDRSQAMGCGALLMAQGYAELKRMYVLESSRGSGVGRGLLEFLEAQAKARGIGLLRLETGHLQIAALRLYERAGYERCPPFGDYVPDPNSVFMEKRTAGRNSKHE
jgi:putative acetyltransferase